MFYMLKAMRTAARVTSAKHQQVSLTVGCYYTTQIISLKFYMHAVLQYKIQYYI